MSYSLVRNGICEDGFYRCKWAKLGRTGSSQSSHAIDEKGRLYGWGQNNQNEAGAGDFQWIDWNPLILGRPDLLDIEHATLINDQHVFIKACSGEMGSLAINDKGELYCWGLAEGETGASPNSNCASFGLPEDSGVSSESWNGIDDPGKEYFFPTPTRATPGYTWKDFAFNYYMGMGIGQDDKLYVWGKNWGIEFGMNDTVVPEDESSYIPIKHTVITEDVKIIDCEYGGNVVVTTDDKVYIFGDWYMYPADWYVGDSYGYPWEPPGLSLPAGVTVVDAAIAYQGCIILLSNGEVYGVGDADYIFGAINGVYYTDTHPYEVEEWTQVPFLVGKNIVKIRYTGLGSGGTSTAIDSDGNIWSMCYDPWYPGTGIEEPDWNDWSLILNKYPGERKWIDVVFNPHQIVASAIDEYGYLWTWGTQSWGPHFAIGAARNQYEADEDPYITEYASTRYTAGYADPPLDQYRNQLPLNILPDGSSDYLQSTKQTMFHKPCGHWHLRLFGEEETLYPFNCWMPTIAVRGNEALLVVCGRHLQVPPPDDKGTEVIMFSYNFDTGVWTDIGMTELLAAGNAPGGAALDTDIYAFFNYKLDATGNRWNEMFSNPALGVWVWHSGSLEYTEFADGGEEYGRNKIGVHSSGLVAVVYTDNSDELLVRCSTDFGASFNLRRTIAADANRKDYGLIVDEDGDIYIAYQTDDNNYKIERSIDNGLNWTVPESNGYFGTNTNSLKFTVDQDKFFMFGGSETEDAMDIRFSTSDCVNWSAGYAITNEPGSGTVAAGSYVQDENYNINLVVVTDNVMNVYIYDEGYQWKQVTVTDVTAEGEIKEQAVGGGMIAGNSGMYAYTAYGFYSFKNRLVAICISIDKGLTWKVVETPLKYYSINEVPGFEGDPLFNLNDYPLLNPKWGFEKSDWNESFVKQKDKY